MGGDGFHRWWKVCDVFFVNSINDIRYRRDYGTPTLNNIFQFRCICRGIFIGLPCKKVRAPYTALGISLITGILLWYACTNDNPIYILSYIKQCDFIFRCFQILASPLAAGVLSIEPPYCFVFLLFYYFFGIP